MEKNSVYTTVIESLLSDPSIQQISKTSEENARELVRQAKRVDAARQKLDSSLRDLHERTSRMEKNVDKHEFDNRGKIIESAIEVSKREGFVREELATFFGLLNSERELGLAFGGMLIRAVESK